MLYHFLIGSLGGSIVPSSPFSNQQEPKAMRTTLLIALLFLTITGSWPARTSAKHQPAGSLSVDYYDETCPEAADIVKAAINRATRADHTVPPALLRLFFHDCFVGASNPVEGCGGCDASVLLNHTGSEQDALPNLTISGFDIIEDIKAELEKRCPCVVSCADALALAARFSVAVSRGPDVLIPLGRRDSDKNSSRDDALRCIPFHGSRILRLLQVFGAVGLDLADLINLSGAHTFGQAHCSNIQARLYLNNGTKFLDPTLDAAYANRALYPTCPKFIVAKPRPTVDDINAENQTVMDPCSPFVFDNNYYVLLTKGQGLFTSDAQLFLDNRTASVVKTYAADKSAFFAGFAKSLIKMGNIKVLTGTKGVIRKYCFRND